MKGKVDISKVWYKADGLKKLCQVKKKTCISSSTGNLQICNAVAQGGKTSGPTVVHCMLQQMLCTCMSYFILNVAGTRCKQTSFVSVFPSYSR